jgi:opacity protein-like surface antigen
MKRLILAMTMAALLATTASAENGWGLGAQYWSASDAGDEVGIAGRLSVEMAEGALLDFRLSWFNDMTDTIGDYDADMEVIPAEIAFILEHMLGDRNAIYGGLGVGYYMTDASVTLPDQRRIDVDTDDEVGYFAVLGGDFTIQSDGKDYGATRTSLFVELMYRVVEVKSVTLEQGESYTIDDAKLDGLVGSLGFLLHW